MGNEVDRLNTLEQQTISRFTKLGASGQGTAPAGPADIAAAKEVFSNIRNHLNGGGLKEMHIKFSSDQAMGTMATAAASFLGPSQINRQQRGPSSPQATLSIKPK